MTECDSSEQDSESDPKVRKQRPPLENKGIESSLPLVKQVHRWCQRRQILHDQFHARHPGFRRDGCDLPITEAL
jgi:hypothetical protein